MSIQESTVPRLDSWKRVFPLDEARRAASFLFQTWREMSEKKPNLFHSSEREPVLTERLHHYIESYSVKKGRLTGFWVNENPKVRINSKTDKVIDRSRTDITYFSNVGKSRLSLIFEFKKLKNTASSRRAYVKKEGMQRFVDGRYADGEIIAAMVAMIVDEKDTCVYNLKEYLLRDQVVKELRMISDEGDKYIRNPSAVFPSIADFDTRHCRSVVDFDKADITIAHVFLTFFRS